MAYLTLEAFKRISVMPSYAIDQLEQVAPGWLDAQLELYSAKLDSRLRKRYDAPFKGEAPLAVRGWLAQLVTLQAYLKRGVDPGDPQFEEYKAQSQLAVDELKEAANAETGLFDLPERADDPSGAGASGIVRGGSLVYSEQSPYVGGDRQVDVGRFEDENRRGSYR